MTCPGRNTSTRRSMIVTVLGGLFVSRMTSAMHMGTVHVTRSLPDNPVHSSDQQEPNYVVVVDAGSGGTRLHAFTFHRTPSTNDFKLDNDSMTHTEPGLSAYANEPEKSAESLTGLLANAKEIIPISERPKTPFVLKGTAGMRLLPKEQADRIFEECRKFIGESGFSATEHSVSIISDADEGIYGWLSLNFLAGQFASNASRTTYAVIDLGGASTEVTFATNNSAFTDLGNHVYPVNAFGRNISVYTISYLGFGVMAAINEILTHDLTKKSSPTLNNETVEIRSQCVHPNISTEWNYGDNKYIVKGPIEPSDDTNRTIDHFVECEKIVDSFVAKMKDKPSGLEEHEVYAISGYYWAANEMGMIDPNGGIVTVDAFEETAKRTCATANTKQPLMCLEITYISVLLQKGFGLEPRLKLYIREYMEGYQLNWALGAAFKLLPTK